MTLESSIPRARRPGATSDPETSDPAKNTGPDRFLQRRVDLVTSAVAEVETVACHPVDGGNTGSVDVGARGGDGHRHGMEKAGPVGGPHVAARVQG